MLARVSDGAIVILCFSTWMSFFSHNPFTSLIFALLLLSSAMQFLIIISNIYFSTSETCDLSYSFWSYFFILFFISSIFCWNDSSSYSICSNSMSSVRLSHLSLLFLSFLELLLCFYTNAQLAHALWVLFNLFPSLSLQFIFFH